MMLLFFFFFVIFFSMLLSLFLFCCSCCCCCCCLFHLLFLFSLLFPLYQTLSSPSTFSPTQFLFTNAHASLNYCKKIPHTHNRRRKPLNSVALSLSIFTHHFFSKTHTRIDINIPWHRQHEMIIVFPPFSHCFSRNLFSDNTHTHTHTFASMRTMGGVNWSSEPAS